MRDATEALRCGMFYIKATNGNPLRILCFSTEEAAEERHKADLNNPHGAPHRVVPLVELTEELRKLIAESKDTEEDLWQWSASQLEVDR